MVKAMAPKAPSGASFMITPMMPNITWAMPSMNSSTGLPSLPMRCRAKANRMAKNSTWRMLPSAKAPTTVFGITFIRKATVLWSSPALA
ncbi:hypothetical protein D3C85_587930 [compost metagenome]